MKMEFTALEDFLTLGIFLRNGDYVYQHDKEGYPLQKDVDTARLFIVTTADKHNLELFSFTYEENKIDLQKNDGYWWVLRLPEPIRGKMGLRNEL